jgi:tetratricopeptide (TPR) repeat protein
MLGTVYQSAGRLDDALANYAKANAINPSAGTYSNIGTIRFWARDYQQAADAYDHAISLSPNQPDLYANLGDAQQKLGQRAKARASYRTAVEKVRGLLAVNENDALNQSLLGLYLAKLADWPGADAAIQKALAMTPQDADVLYSAAIVDALAGKLPESCTKLETALARGASVEIVRRADEVRVLKGCPAYDRVGPR